MNEGGLAGGRGLEGATGAAAASAGVSGEADSRAPGGVAIFEGAVLEQLVGAGGHQGGNERQEEGERRAEG